MLYQSIRNTQCIATVLLTELDSGEFLGANLMKLAGQTAVDGGVYAGNMQYFL